MNYKIITGMSQEYFDNIGKLMLESWIQYWPTNFCITVYTEDIIDFDHPRVLFEPLDNMEQEYHDFQNAVMKLERRTKTFAKKAWPIITHLASNTGRLIWLDADVITESEITEQWLNTLIAPNDFSAHLGVPQASYYAVETGFFMINLENKFKNEFLNEYRRTYYEKDFAGVKKPFDGDVFGKVITFLKNNPKFTYTELNQNFETSLSPFNHVFRSRMKHYKARRKEIFKET